MAFQCAIRDSPAGTARGDVERDVEGDVEENVEGNVERRMSESNGMGSRHRGREVALQVLYAIDLAQRDRHPGERSTPIQGGSEPKSAARAFSALPGVPADEPEVSFDRVAENFEVPRAAREFARGLVSEVRGHAAEVDEMIDSHARNWRLSRMAAVDLNILRLGSYELLFTDTPVAVIVDEAVDLARRFGSDPSPAFVNGILDAVARTARGGLSQGGRRP